MMKIVQLFNNKLFFCYLNILLKNVMQNIKCIETNIINIKILKSKLV